MFSWFRANLTASLTDLVQMECLARSTQVIRVISGDDVGYLYFQRGEIVHAMSSNAVGESAALEILGWETGSFEPCTAGWTSVPTISTPWQALVMRAATARDEARRDETKKRTVVTFPRERTQATMPDKPSQNLSGFPRPERPGSGQFATPAASAPAQSTASGPPSGRGIERAVRLDAEGKVVSTRGDADELAAMTAYATRLSSLIGERLGMETLRAVECMAGTTRRLFYIEKNGNLIGLETPADVDLTALREKLGL
jgi:hypothetical protein